MRVTVFGAGYVGLVTAACFADLGNQVICVDVDEKKLAQLAEGKSPIYEPGLDELLLRGQKSGNLEFTADIQSAVEQGEFIFIAVGTPSEESGSADLQYVLAVAKSIGEYMNGYKLVIDKSTVPLGTADKVRQVISNELGARGVNYEFDVSSNPEFLKEGAAIEDFMYPDRVVIGIDNLRAEKRLKTLYTPLTKKNNCLVVMDVRSAELTKYAANAMLATKISFMNEMSQLAERVGADIEMVRQGIGSDSRIGYHFIYPGCGYGGSCFPKDVRALVHTAAEHGFDTKILGAVQEVNEKQKELLLEKVLREFQGDIQGKTFALWGLAFKPKTDDIREAPSRVLMEGLWQHGAKVQAYDPAAMDNIQAVYGARDDLYLATSASSALTGADALIVVTEWTEFRSPDFNVIKKTLNQPLVIDGRNIYDAEHLESLGITYRCIGRGEWLMKDVCR
ncbi:UDP-glucose dehydrogenase family protein [Piscirickettsia salmonis]|uniref:UDP-glucose dehydrogenase family protein n=1 Tax=Piscirickettsia salmonis TaxID=1238 RepID=UPI0002F72B6A|nr:UDP-glucose/GDP-mannose dehydrogenase family protein [Piscirickettsia salmonis]APS56966.1 UDP-glucose 6-dehydrogenase [Piscirickettsia salmonis]ERL61183.1 nucleotide sugar dehydrogenase family protein [Piscirickettsia salmonis LF-89 = ATCC VR-1361]PEQ16200.1 UDP-glucose/GDP-mannose dehydrogenase family protein [Piscirickettsia salmonis]QGN78341.1 UDP-glucose 6-dehydrogenase TuaD [Piscirickettsia salmonis]QGN81924.1 UDP-glucose 6-dehydrogenase TuaD [Piscirickettsia salmonis]